MELPQVVEHVPRRLVPVAHVLPQAVRDNSRELARHVRTHICERRRRVAQDARCHRGGIAADERALADGQLVQHNAEREQIGAMIHR
jgi:hypothetical protein